jgi:hypothetical protein
MNGPLAWSSQRRCSKASESTTDGAKEYFAGGKKYGRRILGAGLAHLYCIGDGTLIRNQSGESDAAIVRMKTLRGTPDVGQQARDKIEEGHGAPGLVCLGASRDWDCAE